MLIKKDQSALQSYYEDTSNLQGGHAEGAYLPGDEKEVVEALRECAAKKVPITISGGETGTTGGCIPFGGWVLATEKLNRIITLDKQKKIAVVQPAVTLEELDKTAKKEGLMYPPDPTEQTAFLGGTVSTNASGSRSFKFGSTRDWVHRLRVALSSGEVLDIKRGQYKASGGTIEIPRYKKQDTNNIQIPNYQIPNVKTSAGYFSRSGMDFIDLFIGSEGTLGVVTEIEVALIPRFHDTFDVIAFFPIEDTAVDFVEEVKRHDALTLEYFDKNSLELLRPSYSHIPQNAGAAVYLEIEITEENEATYLDHWANILQKHGADLEEAWMGINDKQKEDLRQFRHSMPEHINEEFKKHHTVKFASDIAVPDNKFREMLGFYNSQLTTYDSQLLFVKFGHIGQNHLHVNLVPRSKEHVPLAKDLIMRFVKKGISLGGTCSAEHGIGKIKHPYLREMFGDKGIAEMVRIKKAFDPACILNQGNVFPKELIALSKERTKQKPLY